MNATYPPAAEELSDRGFFTFNDDVVSPIHQFIEDLEGSLSLTLGDVDEWGQALLYLNAAEFALLPALIRPPNQPLVPIREPIPVGREAALLAITKSDCMCLNWPNHTSRIREGKPTPLWEVTAFAADVSKLAAVDIAPEDPITDIAQLSDAVGRLERAHSASGNRLAQQVAEAGVLKIQGFLWSVKISLLTMDASEAVRTAANEFEITAPAHAGA
jgi:hypothetical protein